MVLEGVVTNVAAFGAFVDIGVHQDGLVHISALSNTYVKDPRDVVKSGDVVRVKVLEVDEARKRIGLTLRLDRRAGQARAQAAGWRWRRWPGSSSAAWRWWWRWPGPAVLHPAGGRLDGRRPPQGRLRQVVQATKGAFVHLRWTKAPFVQNYLARVPLAFTSSDSKSSSTVVRPPGTLESTLVT